MSAADLAQVRVFPAALDAVAIREACAKYPPTRAKADYAPGDLRKGRVSWIDDGLKDQLWRLVSDINAEFFRFDLDGILEPLQYAVYGPGDHFGWHVDAVAGQKPYRKLSLSVQLSDPSDYDGGELQMQLGCWTMTMPKGLGDVIAFPTWLPHRVLPVTRGVRHALVVWAAGPVFR